MTLLPASIDLAGADAVLLMRPGREFALKRALAPMREHFDVIIIDCPPSLGIMTLNGLTAADSVLVPLQCETLAHRGVGQLLRTVREVQQITNPDLRLLGALPTLYDARTTHSRDVLADVSDRYALPVLAPPIPRTVRFAEASASGATVLAGRKNKGAQAYRALAEQLSAFWWGGKDLETLAADRADRRSIRRGSIRTARPPRCRAARARCRRALRYGSVRTRRRDPRESAGPPAPS